MQIDQIVCPHYIEEKLEVKHQVTVNEARQMLLANPRLRFVEKGDVEGEMEENKRLSSISKASSYEDMGEFWDTHDFTDFDDPKAPDVEFKITCTVPIELDLSSALEKLAKTRGVGVEMLVNLWLQQKLAEYDQ